MRQMIRTSFHDTKPSLSGEDDVDMDDRPARRCRFLDDEAGDASDSADEQVRALSARSPLLHVF